MAVDRIFLFMNAKKRYPEYPPFDSNVTKMK